MHVACSISGGADSDILVDMCERAVPYFVSYVFFDTGIEYQATKEHLNYLEDKYGIHIDREKAVVPVPLGNKQYGKPFLSKNVSNMIWRLQSHDFQWEDEPFDILYARYPRCKSALEWWCCTKGSGSHFNITVNSWLKEFIMKNPPPFKISDKCCNGAKKNVFKKYQREKNIDIAITGVRKCEGGVRSVAYKSSTFSRKSISYFLPILYFTDADRHEYEEIFHIQHSKCYTEYGLQRTGCAGCPYGQNCDFEREVLAKYEPNLYKATTNMWGDVYEYTRKYHEFQHLMNLKYKRRKKCSCGCTEFADDDIAMNLKFLGRDTKKLLCKECFKKQFSMTEERYNSTIEGFKAQGCELF